MFYPVFLPFPRSYLAVHIQTFVPTVGKFAYNIIVWKYDSISSWQNMLKMLSDDWYARWHHHFTDLQFRLRVRINLNKNKKISSLRMATIISQTREESAANRRKVTNFFTSECKCTIFVYMYVAQYRSFACGTDDYCRRYCACVVKNMQGIHKIHSSIEFRTR